MRFQELDTRMRVYETYTDLSVPAGNYMVARIDGRGFSRLTKETYEFEAPFDLEFRDMMIETTKHLMHCGFKVQYAYTESDEISLLFHMDEASFDRKLRKYISLLAGEASAAFSLQLKHAVCFDCRISILPNEELTAEYFYWRAEDADRMALDDYCYWTMRKEGAAAEQAAGFFGGKSVDEKLAYLLEKGIDYHQVPAWQRRGVGLYQYDVSKERPNPNTGVRVMSVKTELCVDYELPVGEDYKSYIRQRIAEMNKHTA